MREFTSFRHSDDDAEMSGNDVLDDQQGLEHSDFDEEEGGDQEDSDRFEERYGREEGSDFPDEEDDEDNPDWYRLPETDDEETAETSGEHWEEGASDPPTEGAEDDALFGSNVHDDRVHEAHLGPREARGKKAPERKLDLHYDADGFFGYVLIRKDSGGIDKTDINAVSDALRVARVNVVRTGNSHRPAGNGVHYDWYLRVQGPGGDKPSAEKISNALRRFSRLSTSLAAAQINGVESTNHAATRIATLEAQLEQQRSETALLSKANDVLGVELAVARDSEKRTRQREAELEGEFIDRIQRLLSSIGQIRNDADGARKASALIAQERDWIAEEAAARIREAEEGQNEFVRTFDPVLGAQNLRNQRLEHELQQVQNERDMIIFERDTALEEHSVLQEELRGARDERAYRMRDVDLKELLKALLPSVQLMSGSTDVMLMELPDPAPVLRLLQQLASQGTCTHQKHVRDTPGWWSTHYSTGQKDDGRLYFARKGSDRWIALVSRKTKSGDQRQDIERIRKVVL